MASIETTQSDIALMIDNETLALGPDAYLTQVGLIVVDTRNGDILVGPEGFWLTTVGQESRKIDPDTVRWWLTQDPNVIQSVFAPQHGMPRTTPGELFDRIKDLVQLHPGMTVWASPAMFDLAQLTHLWEGRKPWKYNQERDMMTLYKLLDPQGKLQPAANDMGHNAVEDAKWQAEYLVALLRRLRELEAGASMGPAEWAMQLSRLPSDPVGA